MNRHLKGTKNFKKHSKCSLSNTFDQTCVLYFLNVCSYEHTCCFMCFWAMNTTLVFCVYFWFRSPLTHVCPCVLQAKIIWPVWKNTCATCFRATLIIFIANPCWICYEYIFLVRDNVRFRNRKPKAPMQMHWMENSNASTNVNVECQIPKIIVS